MPITRRGRSCPANPAIIPAWVLPVTEHTIDRVEEDAQLPLLLLDLARPAGEAQPAQPMVGRARRDRVRLAAGRLDLGDRPIPALLEADPEARLDQPHVRTGEPAEQDVADLVVDAVRPVDPALLDQHALHARRTPRRPPPAGCGWTARRRSRPACRSPGPARRPPGIRACGSCCRRRRSRSCSPPAWPTLGAAEVPGQAVQPVHRRGPEEQRIPVEVVKCHANSRDCRKVSAARVGFGEKSASPARQTLASGPAETPRSARIEPGGSRRCPRSGPATGGRRTENCAPPSPSASRADPLAPVTVLVPTNLVGVLVRRALARGFGRRTIAALDVLTVDRLAERIAAPALVGSGRRPATEPVLAAAWRRALAADPGVFEPVAEHPTTVRALAAAHRELREVDDAGLDAIAARRPDRRGPGTAAPPGGRPAPRRLVRRARPAPDRRRARRVAGRRRGLPAAGPAGRRAAPARPAPAAVHHRGRRAGPASPPRARRHRRRRRGPRHGPPGHRSAAGHARASGRRALRASRPVRAAARRTPGTPPGSAGTATASRRPSSVAWPGC